MIKWKKKIQVSQSAPESRRDSECSVGAKRKDSLNIQKERIRKSNSVDSQDKMDSPKYKGINRMRSSSVVSITHGITAGNIKFYPPKA